MAGKQDIEASAPSAHHLSADTQDVSQIKDSSYYGLGYVSGGRVFSFAHQIETVRRMNGSSVVEVGPGMGVVTAALRQLGIDVTTVDVQPTLRPDVVASVLELPFDGDSHDVAICAQVLEHLPFVQFIPALKELRRVVRTGVVLSLPDMTPHWLFRIKLHRFFQLTIDRSFGLRKPPPIPPERYERNTHYWEIGYAGTLLRDVEAAIGESGLRIVSTWRVPEKPWHRFFDLRK